MCLFVLSKRQNDVATPDPRVGLWMVKDKNAAQKKSQLWLFLKMHKFKPKNLQTFSICQKLMFNFTSKKGPKLASLVLYATCVD